MSSELLVRGECKICLNDELEIAAFLVFPCGHCFCKQCISSLYSASSRQRVRCPLCRKFWLHSDAHNIIFHPVILDLNSVDRVVEGLGHMDENCNAISVKRAHTELTRVAKGAEGDNAGRLLKAIEDFTQRIVPLLGELEEGRTKIKQLEHLNHNVTAEVIAKTFQVENLENEARAIRKSKAAAEKNFVEAVETADALQKKVNELQRSLTDVKRNLAEKEQDYKRVKDLLGRHKSAAETRERKVKELKEQVTDLNTKLQERENIASASQDSLMVIDHECHAIETPSGLCMRPSNPAPLRRFPEDETWVDVRNFEFEAMPRPGFHSDWSLNSKKTSNILKKQSNSKANSNFPLNLNTKGRPTTAVQLGPKSTIRLAQPF